MKRSRISQKLEGVRKVLKSNDTAVVGLGEESKVHEVETSRIVSSEASHYILVKGADIVESQSSQDEEEEEESDSQIRQSSQTSSLDMRPSTCIASFPGSIPTSGDVESGIHVGPDGACPTASREEIEHEVRKFFRNKKESLGAENAGSKPSFKIGLAGGEVGGEKCAAAARGGRYDAIVLESESGGEEETEQDHKHGSQQENVISEEGTSELETNDDTVSVIDQSVGGGPSSSQSRDILADGTAITQDSEAVHKQSQLSRDSVTTGQSESSILATAKQSNDILPPQSTSNLATSSVVKEENKYDLLSYDPNTKENTKASSPSIVPIDLTTIHTTQGEPKSLEVSSPQKQTIAESVDRDLLHSTESSAAAVEMGLIESDDGGSPSLPAAATEGIELIKSDDGGSPSPSAAAIAEVESDDRGSPSPRAAEWTGGEEVESLLTVAPLEAQEQLSLDVEQLEKERTRQSRAAASVSNQMYKEAQVHVHGAKDLWCFSTTRLLLAQI